MNHPPAFIVTIERNSQRAKHTQQLLDNSGIKADLWLGVDGTQPIKFNPGESVDQRAFFTFWLYHVHPTQVGCYLSHYRLWKHALKHNLERIIVFEDDIAPQPQLETNLSATLALDNSYEHINISPFNVPAALSQCHQHLWELPRTISTGRLIVRALKSGLGTRGYIINRSGIQKSIPKMMPITTPIDEQISRLSWTADLRSFDIWPGMLFHDENAANVIKHGYREPGFWKKTFLKILKRKTWLEHHRVKYGERATARQFAHQCLLEHQAAQHAPHPQPAAPNPKDSQ